MAYPARTIHTLSVVFRLIDGFSGKLLNDASFSFMSGSRVIIPVRKPDGLFVMTDLCLARDSEITVVSPYYCPQRVSGFSKLDPRNPVMTVRLKPGTGYPLQKGTSAYAGSFTHPDGSYASGIDVEIHGSFRDGTVKLKSVKKAQGSAYATLTNPYGLDYTGLTFSTPSKANAGSFYSFKISSRIDNLTFEIEEKTAGLPEPEAVIQRVYSSISDASGRVLMPVAAESGLKDGDMFEAMLLAADGANRLSKKVQLVKGSIKSYKEALEW